MKIAILSNLPKSYSTMRIKEAAKARGHKVRVLASSKFSLDIKSGKPDLLYKGKPLNRFDAVIPRVASSSRAHGVAVVQQFEQMGTYCLNSHTGVSIARDKLRSMQLLSTRDINIPPTAFVFDKSDISPALERVGGSPVIIKLLQGSQGAGVILAETKQMAFAIIEALQIAGKEVLIQKFVSESSGKDIRAFVVGDRVVGAMKRIAQKGEFRSNVHLGARTEAVELSEEYKKVAVRAASIIGLRVAGVDILESNDGPQVLEVNSSPGLEGIEGATHTDIADVIISYLEEQVMFPDIDIRDRLSLAKNYRVAEIPIRKNSAISEKSLSDSIFSDIQILSITRDGKTTPNPKPTEVVAVGDLILCYGQQEVLKSLIPKKKKRRSAIKNLPEKTFQELQDISDNDPREDYPIPSTEFIK